LISLQKKKKLKNKVRSTGTRNLKSQFQKQRKGIHRRPINMQK
jgi:hypothetical protein